MVAAPARGWPPPHACRAPVAITLARARARASAGAGAGGCGTVRSHARARAHGRQIAAAAWCQQLARAWCSPCVSPAQVRSLRSASSQVSGSVFCSFCLSTQAWEGLQKQKKAAEPTTTPSHHAFATGATSHSTHSGTRRGTLGVFLLAVWLPGARPLQEDAHPLKLPVLRSAGPCEKMARQSAALRWLVLLALGATTCTGTRALCCPMPCDLDAHGRYSMWICAGRVSACGWWEMGHIIWP